MRVLDLETIDYDRALGLQRECQSARIAGEAPDTLFLLEHPHVFTLGRGGLREDLPQPGEESGHSAPVFRIGRGGRVTYHGPGQTVGYAILGLKDLGIGVHEYLRLLESVLIETLREFSLEGRRIPDLTGVWIGDRKIASIGIGVRRWVSLHGFALNRVTDLEYFRKIRPCGLDGDRMTSMERELGQAPLKSEVHTAIVRQFGRVFGYDEVEES